MTQISKKSYELRVFRYHENEKLEVYT